MSDFLRILVIICCLLFCCSKPGNGGSEDSRDIKNSGGQNSSSISGEKDMIVSTVAMIDENHFWEIIDKSKKNTKNLDEQEQYLINELINLPQHEIIGFYHRVNKLILDSYTSNLACAGYLMNGGLTDDGFEYFRLWIISRGKNVYYGALENPDILIDEIRGNDNFYEFEAFMYVAANAFKRKTGKAMYDHLDKKIPYSDGLNYPTIEFSWDENKSESMKSICPRLFGKFYKK